MAPRNTRTFGRAALLLILAFAAAIFLGAMAPATSAAALPESETCVPSLQRLLSCLDFIEHRTDEIPPACCVQVNATVAEQPCCLMHVVLGHAGKLLGPAYDSSRAMVDVTAKCIGDASVLLQIGINCSGKPLPPLTPEFTFTTGVPPPSSSGATMVLGSSYSAAAILLACFLGFIVRF